MKRTAVLVLHIEPSRDANGNAIEWIPADVKRVQPCCATCRWAEPIVGYNPGGPEFSLACNSDRAFYLEDPGVTVQVRPSHGCVQWEPKEPA